MMYEYRIMGHYGEWGDAIESSCDDLREDERADWFLKDLDFAKSQIPDEPEHFRLERREIGEWETQPMS